MKKWNSGKRERNDSLVPRYSPTGARIARPEKSQPNITVSKLRAHHQKHDATKRWNT